MHIPITVLIILAIIFLFSIFYKPYKHEYRLEHDRMKTRLLVIANHITKDPEITIVKCGDNPRHFTVYRSGVYEETIYSTGELYSLILTKLIARNLEGAKGE